MNETFRTIEKSKFEGVIRSKTEETLYEYCLLQFGAECPSFGATLLLCGLCPHAKQDHQAAGKLIGFSPVHVVWDNDYLESFFSTGDYLATFRHEGYDSNGYVVSLDCKRRDKK